VLRIRDVLSRIRIPDFFFIPDSDAPHGHTALKDVKVKTANWQSGFFISSLPPFPYHPVATATTISAHMIMLINVTVIWRIYFLLPEAMNSRPRYWSVVPCCPCWKMPP
jgi:hypothetical protein